MRKFVLRVALLAMLVALPALAGADPGRHDKHQNNNGGGGPAVSQEFDQETDSGDVNQTFNVSSEGDNGNQCVGITGNTNTGNAQNQIGVDQYASDADDFGFEDTGADLTVDGTSTTTCDQEVDQAAVAGGDGSGGGGGGKKH